MSTQLKLTFPIILLEDNNKYFYDTSNNMYLTILPWWYNFCNKPWTYTKMRIFKVNKESTLTTNILVKKTAIKNGVIYDRDVDTLTLL